MDTMVIRVNGVDKVYDAPEAQELRFGLTTGDRVKITIVEGQQDVFVDRIEKVE